MFRVKSGTLAHIGGGGGGATQFRCPAGKAYHLKHVYIASTSADVLTLYRGTAGYVQPLMAAPRYWNGAANTYYPGGMMVDVWMMPGDYLATSSEMFTISAEAWDIIST